MLLVCYVIKYKKGSKRVCALRAPPRSPLVYNICIIGVKWVESGVAFFFCWFVGRSFLMFTLYLSLFLYNDDFMNAYEES